MDPIIANNPQIQTRFAAEAGVNLQQAPMQGKLGGQETIEKKDALAELKDAAEELTMQHGEEASKKLSERKIGNRSSLTTSAVEKAEMYLEKMREGENQDKAAQFLDGLKKMGKPSRDDVMGELRKLFKEPGEQHAALAFAEELLAGVPSQKELAQTLHDTRLELEGSFGNEKPAGVTRTGDQVDRLQLDESTKKDLEEYHQNQLQGFGSITDAYKSLIERFGENRFQEALTFLIRSTGSELHGGGLNIPGEKLKTVVDDLFHVQVLGNVQNSLAQLGERMEKQFGQKLTMSPTKMMQGVLALTQNAYCRGDQVSAIAREAGLLQPEAEIFFLTALKDHLRLLPLKVYSNPDTRAKLIDAAQEALDNAIAKEEVA